METKEIKQEKLIKRLEADEIGGTQTSKESSPGAVKAAKEQVVI